MGCGKLEKVEISGKKWKKVEKSRKYGKSGKWKNSEKVEKSGNVEKLKSGKVKISGTVVI